VGAIGLDWYERVMIACGGSQVAS